MRLRKSTVAHVVAVFWLFGTLLNMPTIIHAEFDESEEHCIYVWDKKSVAVLIVLCTSLAAFAIAFCYFKTIKELYFSNTICREGVEQRQDLESKRRIVKLLSSNSGHSRASLLVIFHL